MHSYKGNIDSLKGATIAVPRLLELVLEGITQPLEERKGLDCVLNIIRHINTDGSQQVNVLLNPQERDDLSKLLDKLPPVSAQMSAEEEEAFYHAYDQLPDKLSWQPVINHHAKLAQQKAEQLSHQVQAEDQEPLLHSSNLAQIVYAQPKHKDVTAIECIRHKRVTLEPVALPQPFQEQHREVLRKLLRENPSLPVLHGRMSDEDISAFLEIYRTLEARPNWEPRIIDEHARQTDREAQAKTQIDEAQKLAREIKEGSIDAFIDNGVPVTYVSDDVWLPRTVAMDYLQKRGVLEILEEKYALASSSPQGPNLQGRRLYEQIAAVIEDSSRRDEISDYIAMALRAKQTDRTDILYRWLQDKTGEGELFLFLKSTERGIEMSSGSGVKDDLFTKTYLSKRLSDWRKETKNRLAKMAQ